MSLNYKELSELPDEDNKKLEQEFLDQLQSAGYTKEMEDEEDEE